MMPVNSVGDMALQFSTMRNGSTIKTELADLAQRLSTGQFTDLAEHLEGQTTRYSAITGSLARLEGFTQTNTETDQLLSTMQTTLAQVDSMRGELGGQLLTINDQSQPGQLNEATRISGDTFEAMVATLNTRLADRAMFSGAAVDTYPLADAEVLLADLETSVGGATTVAAISALVDAWFNDPAGGFSTLGYQGDADGYMEKRLSNNQRIEIAGRADDPAIKDVLKAVALAAIADRLPGIDTETKSGLLQEAGQALHLGSYGLVDLQSRLGFTQATVERVEAENTAQQTALTISLNDITAADPFETASRLQSVQLQLETHYTVTARLSQLSLVGYL